MFDFPPMIGGAQAYNWDAVRALPKDNVIILAPKWPGWEAFDSASGYKTYRLPVGWLEKIKLPISPFLISWIAWKEKVDLIWYSKYSRILFLAIFLTRYVLRLPFGMTVYGEDLAWADKDFVFNNAKLAFLLRDKIVRKACKIVSISRFSGAQLPRGTHFFVIYPCIDVQMMRCYANPIYARLYENKDSITYLSIARLTRKKGLDLVLRAFALGLPGVKNPRYIIVGSGDDEGYLKKLAKEYGLDFITEFRGEISLNEKLHALKQADIFVMPSRIEGFGIVFLEAALHGLCAVGSRAGGIPEAVEEGVTGLLVESENIEELRGALAALGSNPSLREKMGKAAQERCLRDFSWEQFAKEWAGLFDKLGH